MFGVANLRLRVSSKPSGGNLAAKIQKGDRVPARWKFSDGKEFIGTS
jgi:hypothetical protein